MNIKEKPILNFSISREDHKLLKEISKELSISVSAFVRMNALREAKIILKQLNQEQEPVIEN